MPPQSRRDIRDWELYQLLVESVLDYAIFVLDPEGNVATWNRGAERLKGYSADEIIGRHFSIFYPSEDVVARKPEWELKVATERGRVEDEGWRVRKDGSRFWANVVITALREDNGTLVGFAKVTRDLTSRRAAEEERRLLAAEQATRAAAEQHNQELRRLNRALRQEALEAESQAAKLQELAQELEQTNEQLEETLSEVEESREAVRAAERRMRFLVQASDALAGSLDYERNIQEVARMVVPDLADWCVVEMAAAQGTTQQVAVAHVNPRKTQLARELRQRYPPDPHATTGVPSVLRTGRPALYAEITDEILAATAHDAEHLAMLRELNLRSAMIVPLNARGKTLGTLTLVSAESGRRFTESDLTFAMELAGRAAQAVENARLHAEAIQARAAAESAAAAKTRFLAVMSHELRTPLNAIGGYAELLHMGLRGPVTEEQQKDLDRIRRNHATLLSLINDVLDYAKLESGSMAVDVTLVNVRREISEVENLVSPQLQAKRIEYDYSRCVPDLSVCADPRSLRQILLNLLSNAIKFTPEGGRITLACTRERETVNIRVTDTGIGIARDKLATIFEPFVQLNRDMSHPQDGTGLGLAISRDLARAMRGDVTVESEVGKGSTFTITLPAAEC